MQENKEILRKLWIEEVPQSKKRRLADLFADALGIGQQAVYLRLTGRTHTNDAEMVFILDVLRKNGINVDEFEDYKNNIKKRYGLYNYTEYQLQ